MPTLVGLKVACTVSAAQLVRTQGQVGGHVDHIQHQYSFVPDPDTPAPVGFGAPLVLLSPEPDLFKVGTRYVLTISDSGFVPTESAN